MLRSITMFLIFLIVAVCAESTVCEGDTASWEKFLPDLRREEDSASEGALREYNADLLDAVAEDKILSRVDDVHARFPLHNIFHQYDLYSAKPLWTIHHTSTVYGEYIGRDLSVYSASKWSELLGFSCPSGHHKHVINHHMFRDLFVCIAVPEKLVSKYRVFTIVQAVNEAKLVCPGAFHTTNGNADVFSFVGFTIHSDNIRLLIDENGAEYLTSTYCLTHYYQLDPSGKEIFKIPHNVTDTTVIFHLPAESCVPVRLPETFSMKFNALPVTLKFKSDNQPQRFNMRRCILKDLAARQKLGGFPLMAAAKFPTSATSSVSFSVRPPNSSWNVVDSVMPELVVHISVSSGSSPLKLFGHLILSIIKPLLDFILDKLLYIFDSLMSIFESEAFHDIFTRFMQFVVVVITKILKFTTHTVWPQLVQFFFSLSLRIKFGFVVLVLCYMRTTKFFFSVGVAVAAVLCVSN